MGFISHRVSRNDLEAGDHIYTYRTAFIYSHHGIYVGRDKVVHFTQDQQSSSSNGSSSSSSSNGSSLSSSSSGSNSCFSSSIPSSRATTCLGIPDCDFRKDGSGVIMSCLNCFLGDGSLYRFQYSSSTLAFVVKFRGGVCTTAQSDPPETVVHRAMHLLHEGFGDYDLLEHNCEDFALYCKTGLLVCGETTPQEAGGSSGQAVSGIGIPLSGALCFLLKCLVSSPAGRVTATAVTYSYSRYVVDIGVRSDKVEVKVEDVVSFLRGHKMKSLKAVEVVR